MLFLATIQMGTLALLCSAFFRTTLGSFLASYVLAFLMFFGPYFCVMISYLVGLMLNVNIDSLLRDMAPNISPGMTFLVFFPFFTPPYFFADTIFPGGMGASFVILHSAIILSVSGGCLVLARRFIVERAFLPPRNPIMSLFKALDGGRARSVKRLPAGPTVAAVATSDELLPSDEPVAWRETTKRVLGHARYMWRIVLVAEIPLIMLCGLIGASNTFSVGLVAAMMRFVMWVLAVLVVSVKSASLVAGERTQQTLDVLCTTPLTGREIVLQKFRGVRRLIVALWVPFLTMSLFVPWWAERHGNRNPNWDSRFSAFLYLVCSALSVGIYFPLVAWLSFLIGLKVRTQIRAIIGSMAAIAAWCIAPLVFIAMPLAIMMDAMGLASGGKYWKYVIQFVSLLSPATMVFMNEVVGMSEFSGPWLSVFLNFAGYGAALVAIRAICLKNADRWLGRAEGKKDRG